MPRLQRSRWRTGLICVGLLGTLLFGAMVSGFVPGLVPRRHSIRANGNLETKTVRKTDLDVTLIASGRIDSAERTIVECELERLELNGRGYGYSAGGASTILSVLPEGSTVKKGDVLCELDSYDYQELVRQQLINMERVRSDLEQATLNLEVARISLTEYRDGLMLQTLKDLRGRIALSEAEFERSNDRLKWTQNMLAKGYLPRGQVTTEEFAANRMALSLKQGRTALALFEKFSAPKYLRVLESNIFAAETTLSFQNLRHQRMTARLEKLQNQVKLCTVRAPHDGFLIYANEPGTEVRIEAGVSVRQKQKLFYLPDLAKMEAIALIHESVLKQVQPGMSVQVFVEGLPGHHVDGHVTKISQLPNPDFFNDVKYFAGTVTLDTIPIGLKPGMSAEVEIGVVHRPAVLAIPSEALTVESGEDFVYVVHDDKIERRPITLGQSTSRFLEIKSGLKEGEEVVIDPSRIDELDEVVAVDARSEDAPAQGRSTLAAH